MAIQEHIILEESLMINVAEVVARLQEVRFLLYILQALNLEKLVILDMEEKVEEMILKVLVMAAVAVGMVPLELQALPWAHLVVQAVLHLSLVIMAVMESIVLVPTKVQVILQRFCLIEQVVSRRLPSLIPR